MKLPLVLLVIAASCLSIAQTFTDQDRFGKSNAEVAALSHENWIAWYCHDSRAGANGRITGEKIYGIALYRYNKGLLESRPQSEQKFFEDVWIKFANMAKYALTIAGSSHPHWSGLSLAVAESGTASNDAIQGMLTSRAGTDRLTPKDLKAEFEKGQKRIDKLQLDEGKAKYVRDHYPGIGKMIDQMVKEFESRSKEERQHLYRFCQRMIRFASDERS